MGENDENELDVEAAGYDFDQATSDDDFSLGDSDADSMFDFHTGRTATENGQAELFGFEEDSEASLHIWNPLPKAHDQNFIRVLRIDPARDRKNPLCCQLEFTTLQQPCLYQALSYAWGRQEATEQVSINSKLHLVSPTLKEAMLRVREQWDENESFFNDNGAPFNGLRPAIWIDALCIQQENDFEKSSQVLLMGQIYSKASCVLIWLGETSTRDDVSLSVFLESADKDTGISTDAEYALCSEMCQQMLDKPWFSRRWTIQETVLQEQRFFLFGGRIFLLSKLENMLHHVHSKNRTAFMDKWDWKPSNIKPDQSLLLNMLVCHKAACHDYRDRIYSLRAISCDGDDFPVDYRLETSEVFMEFATKYAMTELLPMLLVFALLLKNPGRGVANGARIENASTCRQILPTWVPDWAGYFSPWSFDSDGVAKDISFADAALATCKFSRLEPPDIIYSNSFSTTALAITIWGFEPCTHVFYAPTCIRCDFSELRAERQRLWDPGLRSKPDLYGFFDDCCVVFEFIRTPITPLPEVDATYVLSNCSLVTSLEVDVTGCTAVVQGRWDQRVKIGTIDVGERTIRVV